MGVAAILSSYLSDKATVTGAAAVSTLPVTNLLTSDPAQKYRSTGLSSQYVQFDSGASASYAYNTAVFVGVNWTNSATVRIRAGNSDPSVSAAIDVSSIDPWPGSKPTMTDWAYPIALVQWTNSTAYRYYRFDISDAGNSDGYIEIGRGMCGTLWQPSTNIAPQMPGITWGSTDPQQRSSHNKLRTARRGYADRRFDLAFNCLTEAEALDGAYEIARLQGLGGDVVFMLDPSSTTRFPQYSVYGVFGQVRMNPREAFIGGLNIWQFSATILEKT